MNRIVRLYEILRGGINYVVGSLIMAVTDQNYDLENRKIFEMCKATRKAGLGEIIKNEKMVDKGESILSNLLNTK